MEFDRAIALHMSDCHARQLRPKTMLSYEQALKLFGVWLDDTFRMTAIGKITADHIRQYTAMQFPDEYLDRFLRSGEVKEIAKHMNLKNENGRLLEWSSIWPMLQRDGMVISKEKKNGIRGWRVHRMAS